MSSQNDDSRREFLKRAGKLAAYTPPVMMLLMQPRAHAVSSCNNGFGNGSEGCSPDKGAHHNQDESTEAKFEMRADWIDPDGSAPFPPSQ